MHYLFIKLLIVLQSWLKVHSPYLLTDWRAQARHPASGEQAVTFQASKWISVQSVHTFITLVIMFVYCSMWPLPPSSSSATPAPRDPGPPEGMATNLPENEMHYYLSETKLGYIIDTSCLFNLFVFHHEISFWKMKDDNFVFLKQIMVLSIPGWQGSLA